MRARFCWRGVVGALWLVSADQALRADDGAAARLAAQIARAEARKAGFKLEYGEFQFGLTAAEQNRAAAVTNAGFRLQDSPLIADLEWMKPVVRGAARCGWQSGPKWSEVAEALRLVEGPVDAAVAVLLLARPLQFAPPRLARQLPPPDGLNVLAKALTARMALALRAGHAEAAWTNLLAMTALATRYEPVPAEVCEFERAGLVQQAFAATWEALQTNAWSDAQLSHLMAQWSRVDVWGGVPEIPMLQAAGMLAQVAAIRAEYRTNRVVTPELPRLARLGLSAPGEAGDALKSLSQRVTGQADYLRRDSYLDEALILRFCRQRTEDLRRATGQTDWFAMRALPGVTNQNLLWLTTNLPASAQSPRNDRARMIAAAVYHSGGRGAALMHVIAETEARRRVLLAALAIERALLHREYAPAAVAEAAGVQTDFITGKPLRYRVQMMDGGLRYSIGLDAEEKGGEMPRSEPGVSPAGHTDLGWPRRATAEELRSQLGNHGPGSRIPPSNGGLISSPPSRPGTGDRELP